MKIAFCLLFLSIISINSKLWKENFKDKSSIVLRDSKQFDCPNRICFNGSKCNQTSNTCTCTLPDWYEDNCSYRCFYYFKFKHVIVEVVK
jgi:hypothetical protein